MNLDLLFADRILLAALLGAVVGLERDLRGKSAGLRTNMIVCIGACLFAILSSEAYAAASGTQDPTRIASIVVQGAGFLGAGVLLKGDQVVHGLTTASIIWLAAAIGLACGAGMLQLATFVTFFSVLATVALAPLSTYIDKRNGQKGR